MQLRAFTAEDWPWVLEWFKDAFLDRELGPMDRDWLEHVLSRDDGVELVATMDGKPVALIGCVWAGPADGDSHVITDIAVAPSARQQGLGGKALQLALAWPGHPPAKGWKAYVRPGNAAAHSLFAGSGWESRGISEGMMEFAARPG